MAFGGQFVGFGHLKIWRLFRFTCSVLHLLCRTTPPSGASRQEATLRPVALDPASTFTWKQTATNDLLNATGTRQSSNAARLPGHGIWLESWPRLIHEIFDDFCNDFNPKIVSRRFRDGILIDNMIQKQSMCRRRLTGALTVALVPDPADPFDFLPLFPNSNHGPDDIPNHVI